MSEKYLTDRLITNDLYLAAFLLCSGCELARLEHNGRRRVSFVVVGEDAKKLRREYENGEVWLHVRIVPVGKRALRDLLHYIYHVRPQFLKHTTTNALFVSWWKGGRRITKVGIRAMLRRLNRKYRFTETLRVHGFRHACATDLLRNGAPVQDVSKLLGHARLETTQIYTRLLPTDLQKHHRAYHPRG